MYQSFVSKNLEKFNIDIGLAFDIIKINPSIK